MPYTQLQFDKCIQTKMACSIQWSRGNDGLRRRSDARISAGLQGLGEYILSIQRVVRSLCNNCDVYCTEPREPLFTKMNGFSEAAKIDQLPQPE